MDGPASYHIEFGAHVVCACQTFIEQDVSKMRILAVFALIGISTQKQMTDGQRTLQKPFLRASRIVTSSIVTSAMR